MVSSNACFTSVRIVSSEVGSHVRLMVVYDHAEDGLPLMGAFKSTG